MSNQTNPEVRVDPAVLARVSQAYLETSQELFAALRALRTGAPLSTSDLGSVDPAEPLAHANDRALGSAGTLLERLIAVMEVDTESLLRVAFAYQEADEQAAQVMLPQSGPF